MKQKGQRTVAKLKPLALCDLAASWQSGLTHLTYTQRNGLATVRGFESRTRRQFVTPMKALTFTGILEPHSRSHADLNNPSMRLPAVKPQEEISQNDVPQLPY
jgi:hypothetical protein